MALLPSLAFGLSCRDGIIPANAVMHPTEENLPDPGGPLVRADTVVQGLSSERSAEWSAMRRALLDATPVASVGALEGTGPDVFGSITAAAGDADGNIYVLDGRAQEALVFDAAGDFVQRLGGRGEGPEEFLDARDLERLPDGRLVVGQRGAPVKVLEMGPEGYAFADPFVRDQPETLATIDLCALRDRLFFHSSSFADGELAIHEVSSVDGAVLSSLGEAYLATFEQDRVDRSYGRIACGADPPTIVWAFYYFPIVRAFRPDNTLLWTALLDDFTQGPVYQNSPTSPTVHPQGLPTEYVVVVHALRPGLLVLQTLLYERARGTPYEDWRWQAVRRRTYLLDQETGNGGLVSDDLPRIAWVGDGRYMATRSDPYPQVEVRVMPRMGSR